MEPGYKDGEDKCDEAGLGGTEAGFYFFIVRT